MAIVVVSAAAGAKYYTAGYYAGEDTVERTWLGTGTGKLGIGGDVTAEKLEALLRGFHPDGRPLVQNAGSETRQSGWELCFIVDKDLGVKLAATPDPAERRAILACIIESVFETFARIEREVGTTRRGHGGKLRELAGLVAAVVFHHENRNGEPFTHVHVPIANVGVRADGTTGTLSSKGFYERQKEFGRWFTDRLIEKLLALGVDVERTEHGFRLPEVPRELSEALSSRRKEILDEMERKGAEGPKAAEAAAKATRRRKERNSTHEEVRERWRDLIDAHGYRPKPLVHPTQARSTEHVKPAGAEPAPEAEQSKETPDTPRSAETLGPSDGPSKLRTAVRDAIREVAGRANHFDEEDVMRKLTVPRHAKSLGDARIREHEIRQAVRDELGQNDFLRLKGDRFTTQEVVAAEDRLLRGATKLHGRKPKGVKEKLVEQVVRKWVALSDEERAAVRHVTTPKGRSIRFIEAHTGSDRYAVLLAAGEVWQKAGYRVIACSPTNSAADACRKETRIKTLTHQGVLKAVREASVAEKLGHGIGQLLRAAAHLPTRQRKSLIGQKTVLVVDGANTLSTKELAKLVRAAARGGGQIVMVGDRHAVQAYRHGGAFAHLADAFGKVDLKENKTQESPRAKGHATAVREGRPADFLRDLQKAKRLFVGGDRHETVQTLVADWSRQNPVDQKRSLILAASDHDVRDLNQRCQASRRHWDRISAKSVTNGKERFHEGDRVLFTRGSKVYGLLGGERGTVTSVSEGLNILTAKLDRDKTVTVPLRRFEHVRLGYAMTARQAQAATAERVFALAGGPAQDKGLAAIQASRHRDTLRVYADERDVGPGLGKLNADMARSREQSLAHKHLEEARQRQREERSPEQGHARQEPNP
jgi:conjugative relaxase-like TrwC/TraI family protein